MKIFAIIALFFVNITSFAQDISGNWTGILKQQAGGTRTEYFLSMDIEQNGKNIEGTSYINYFDKPEIYALFKFSGKFENNKFKYTESEIISQREDQMMYWCTKLGTLKYSLSGDTEVISGNWYALQSDCMPGTLYLSRKKNTAKNISEEITKNNTENKVIIKPDNNQKRKTAIGTNIKLKAKTVTLKIYDHGKEDNDTISLYFNDKLLLDNFRLPKNPFKLIVEIDPKIKINKLVFFAKNLGTFPPNTAAVIIEAEGFTKKVILRSDFNQSDVINFEIEK